MSEENAGNPPATLPLPENPNLDWLRKQAKRRLDELRATNPEAKLADAQFEIARRYGFASWRALKSHIDTLSEDGQLVEAIRKGEFQRLTEMLHRNPEKLRMHVPPYEWSLLHVAAQAGHLAIVDLLLSRGLDVNARERGDNTYAMHWAAAGGHLEVVRRLADAGGDVIGDGDDHGLQVIGWATCWGNRHANVAEFLVSRGAPHHIFSAIALNLSGEVRRIVAADPGALNSRLTRNDNHRTPLHHAVLNQSAEMVSLLLELGADPMAVDGAGVPAAVCATGTDFDRKLMERIRELTRAELDSATRGNRAPRLGMLDLIAALALGDAVLAGRLATADSKLVNQGALHVMAKRGDQPAVEWLLAHGADPNRRWAHWDAEVTPLHLAAQNGHVEVMRTLLEAGGDPTIHDSKHDSGAAGWAQYGRMPPHSRWREMVQVIEEREAKNKI
jgi:ankyrin repeat protein